MKYDYKRADRIEEIMDWVADREIVCVLGQNDNGPYFIGIIKFEEQPQEAPKRLGRPPKEKTDEA